MLFNSNIYSNLLYKFKNEIKDISTIFEDYLNHSEEESFKHQLIKTIIDNLSDPELNVNRIADELSISRSKLYRKIKENNLASVNDLIIETRLNLAHELLKNPEANVSDVAYKVGYSSPSYFSKSFTQKFGKSPSEVIKG